jgi:hypothetical protein
MPDFDPNLDPQTQEEADAYVDWCATNFIRLTSSPDRTYRTALRCAAWLFVVAAAPLHLDDAIEQDRDALMTQLAAYSLIARAIERQRERFAVERLIITRSSLDCWEPAGEWAGHLLTAAKCAIGALVLIELHPLIELWELECPEVWALLDASSQLLAQINIAVEEPSFADFAVRRNELTIARFTWQRANNLVRHLGIVRLSEN